MQTPRTCKAGDMRRRPTFQRLVLLVILLFALASAIPSSAATYPGPVEPPFQSAKTSTHVTPDIRGVGSAQADATALKSGAMSSAVTATSVGYVDGANPLVGPVGLFIEPQGNSGPSYGIGATKAHAYGEIEDTIVQIPQGTYLVTATFDITLSQREATPATGGDGSAPFATANNTVDLVIKYFPATCGVTPCTSGETEVRAQSQSIGNGFIGQISLSSDFPSGNPARFTASAPGGWLVVQPGIVSQVSCRGSGSYASARLVGSLVNVVLTPVA